MAEFTKIDPRLFFDDGESSGLAAKAAELAEAAQALAVSASLAGVLPAVVITPLHFWESHEPIASAEMRWDSPCPSRRGKIDADGRIHFCEVCGAWAVYGYDAGGGRRGTWFCRAHRPENVP